jgi:hypothetical protein
MSNASHDLFYDKTLYIIGGSTEILRISFKNGSGNEDIDLQSVKDVEWRVTPYSVKSRSTVLCKNINSGDIHFLKNPITNTLNTVQIVINSADTENLSGAFLHQVVITDSNNKQFVPFQGLLIIGVGIQRN